MQKIIYTIAEIRYSAQKVLSVLKSNNLCMYGPMGAGKTTLIKALIAELGSIDEASSPTFGLVNEYHDNNGKVLAYHFDFYRLEDETEALEMGLEYYLNQEVWMFMEWPEKIPSLLPEPRTEIHISIVDEETRELEIVEIG